MGSHAEILETYEGQMCNVMPFNDRYAPIQNVHTAYYLFMSQYAQKSIDAKSDTKK